MTEKEEDFILSCVEKQIDDSLTDEEAQKLEKLILNNPEACTFYNDFMAHHAALQDNTPISVNDLEEEKKSALIIFYKFSLVAAAMLIVFLGVSLLKAKNLQPEKSIARIEKTENCKWLNSSLPTDVGSELKTGKLSLETGLATIKFNSGAEVILEAPASVELINDMHCRILDGTVLAKVPESAHGFQIDTPSASAIDHGTEFLISYNAKSDQSLVEVLEGEVEVRPGDTAKSKRLFTGEAALLSKSSIEDKKPVEGMPNVKPELDENSQFISTETGGGEDAYVLESPIRGHDSNIHLLVKKSETTTARRKAYLKFDLSGMNSDFKSVSLHLSIQPSGFGFASLVPDSTFTVYGLNEDSSDNWSRKELTWDNAPANAGENELDFSKLTKLGTFEVKRGVYSGIVSMESEELKNFLINDKNRIATLIIMRNTGEFSSHGLVHAFASKRHPTDMAPTLELKK